MAWKDELPTPGLKPWHEQMDDAADAWESDVDAKVAGKQDAATLDADVAANVANGSSATGAAVIDHIDALAWASTPLSSVDLNTVTAPGIYRMATTANGTLANNYPVNGSAGVIEVLSLSGETFLIQRFTPVAPSASRARGIWQRYCSGGTWDPWHFIPSQRIDNTAGKAIYTWDDTANAERLIFYASGRRDITPLASGVAGGSIYIERNGDRITLTFNSVVLEAGTGILNLFSSGNPIPAGFRKSLVRYRVDEMMGAGSTVDTPAWMTWFGLNTVRFVGSGVTAGGARPTQIDGAFDVRTDDALPTTLPGTAA